ncbi:MAG: hypothetical protein M1838_002111 [Thelocarpon superellum]|nr:MAG: hypothetical protein M1838_002111 [Thelocarpon superellum]
MASFSFPIPEMEPDPSEMLICDGNLFGTPVRKRQVLEAASMLPAGHVRPLPYPLPREWASRDGLVYVTWRIIGRQALGDPWLIPEAVRNATGVLAYKCATQGAVGGFTTLGLGRAVQHADQLGEPGLPLVGITATTREKKDYDFAMTNPAFLDLVKSRVARLTVHQMRPKKLRRVMQDLSLKVLEMKRQGTTWVSHRVPDIPSSGHSCDAAQYGTPSLAACERLKSTLPFDDSSISLAQFDSFSQGDDGVASGCNVTVVAPDQTSVPSGLVREAIDYLLSTCATSGILPLTSLVGGVVTSQALAKRLGGHSPQRVCRQPMED